MPAAISVRDGDVLHVTLTRPESRNAFDDATAVELAAAFAAVGDARAVVLRGEGASFSAGASIEWMRSSGDLSFEENLRGANAMRSMFEAIDACPAPVVALVHGHALGGGVGLVACADVVIAHPETVFGFSEVRLGILPAVISPFVIRAIGPRQARRLFLTGERFDAATALRLGLVHETTDDLDGALARVLAQLRAGGPAAVRGAKRLVLDAPDGPETARRIAEARAAEEGREGLAAFLEGRPPSWAPGSEA